MREENSLRGRGEGEGGMEEGRRESEGERDGGMEEGRDVWKEGGRERYMKGGREGGRVGNKVKVEWYCAHTCIYMCMCIFLQCTVNDMYTYIEGSVSLCIM